MTNDLRQRLEVLKDAAKSQNPSDVLPYAFELERAFASGDLVTRSEMEDAVAKAVAEEREACAALCDSTSASRLRQIKESDSSPEQNERWRCGKQQAEILAEVIRARSEQKERE